MPLALSQPFVAATGRATSLGGAQHRAGTPLYRALPQPHRAAGAARRRGLPAVQAAWTPVSSMAPASTSRLDLQLPVEDFQTAVTLTALRRRKGGTAVLIQEVAPGSASAAAGVRPGQQLLGVSDPVRINEVWELNGLTSLKYVQQAVAGRAGETIAVRLTPEPVPEWRQAAAAARAAVAAAGGDSSDSEGELTAQERAELLSQLEQLDSRAKQAKQAARMEKIETRNSYDLEERSSTPFFVAFIAFFIGLPAVALLAALGSGYLDSLGPR